MGAELGDCPNCGASAAACKARKSHPLRCCGPCLRREIEHPVLSFFTEPTVEGLPGTWSHCGRRADHKAHRHQVVVNEGPYDNVLCLGTPGDPNAYAPPVQLQYPPVEEL